MVQQQAPSSAPSVVEAGAADQPAGTIRHRSKESSKMMFHEFTCKGQGFFS
jgi:hypothetical protein